MNEIQVKFRCGHREAFARDAQLDAVCCGQCGSRRVMDVQAPPPVIRARGCEASGPLVQQET